MAATGRATTARRTSSTGSPPANEGANFGFPYCHANGIPDPDIKVPNACAGVTLPVATTGPHAAGMGIKFYTGNMFPEQYRNVAFIARRGSWNRAQKFGYDVIMARVGTDGTAKLEPFMTGLLDEAKNEFHGRPVYIHQMQDGALLVSDEQNGAIYRISHAPQRASRLDGLMHVVSECWRPLVLGLAAAVFYVSAACAQGVPLEERIQQCAGCHGEDGNSRLENIPSLAGQPEFFVMNQLVLMREGVRRIEAMMPFVKDLKDDDIDRSGQAFRQAGAQAER